MIDVDMIIYKYQFKFDIFLQKVWTYYTSTSFLEFIIFKIPHKPHSSVHLLNFPVDPIDICNIR